MSSDRFQRQIDTIVEQQAKFSEDMLMLKDALLSLTNIVGGLAEQVEGIAGQVEGLTGKVEGLVEHGKETDARLNMLITLFERHVTEDHRADAP
jgi:hypothetical protein